MFAIGLKKKVNEQQLHHLLAMNLSLDLKLGSREITFVFIAFFVNDRRQMKQGAHKADAIKTGAS